MATPFYKDVGKNANDLTNKGFVSTDRYQWKFEVDTTSDNGVQFLPSLTQTTAGAVEGELKTKFKACSSSWTVSGNLKNDLSVEATSEPAVLRGLVKPTLTVNTSAENPVDRARVKLATESRLSLVPSLPHSFTTTLEFPVARFYRDLSKSETPKANLSLVMGIKDTGISVGGEVELAPETAQVRASNGVLSYTRPNLEVTLFGKKRDTNLTVGANFYQRLPSYASKSAAVGAELTTDFSEKPASLTLAGTVKPDPTSTLKARLTSRGVLGLAYTQQFNGPFALTVGSDLDVLRAQEPGSFNWGVKLNYK
jgi:hypothetical protein